MVNLQKSGDSAVRFIFTDSDHYLYGNGEIEVPVNSLLLVIDESDMVTFKKLSGDPFLSFRADNSNLGTKAAIEQFYKENMVGSTGGGSESGITSGEVQTMIDESISGKADTAVVNQAISEATQAILSVSGDVQTKADASALTAHADNANVHFSGTQKSNYDYLEGQYYADDSWDIMPQTVFNDFTNDYSMAMGQFDQRISANTSAIATKADTSAVTAVNDALTAHTANTTVHVSQTEKDIWNAKVDTSAITSSITSGSTDSEIPTAKATYDAIQAGGGGGDVTIDPTLDSGSTNPVANSAITTALDAKQDALSQVVYSIEGKNRYTANHNGLYERYKNPRYDYTVTSFFEFGNINGKSVLRPNGNESSSWGGDFELVEKSAITSSITSGSTDSEIPTAKATYDAIQAGGGGGMDDDTQQLISTALNDLNDRKADLTELSKYQKKGDYVVTSTLADYMTNDAFDEYATAKERIISGALNDLNDKFGGLRLVKLSQSEYDALSTKDSSTLYIISD